MTVIIQASLFLRGPVGMRLCGGSLRLCHTGRCWLRGEVGRAAARAGEEEEEEAMGERGKVPADEEGGEEDDEDDADCCNLEQTAI